MNKHISNTTREDDVFTLYSLLESRIEMLEEKVSQLRKEIATLKTIIDEKKRV